MTISEIIEYEGRRFVRTGEVRKPKRGEFYLSPSSGNPHMTQRDFRSCAHELLRELPAETPAQVTCHFPFIPGKTPSGQDKIPRTCAKCGAYPVASWEDKHMGLLAEAEEALEKMSAIPIRNAERWKELIAKGEYRDDPGSQHAAELRADENRTVAKQLIIEAESVLARIRAAKEKP